MIGNAVGEAHDLLVQLGRYGLKRYALERVHQGMGEAMHAVSVPDDAVALHLIQDFPHLLRRVGVVIEERDELGDGALEVDVVLPERVVGVNEQSLRVVDVHPVCHRFYDSESSLWRARTAFASEEKENARGKVWSGCWVLGTGYQLLGTM